MRRNTRVVRGLLAGALLVTGTWGCNDFLNGGKAKDNTNQPTGASRDQLFIGMQATQFAFQEGSVVQIFCMWIWQCRGTGGRFEEDRGTYGITATDTRPDWAQVHAAGGLVDLRTIEQESDAGGDKLYLGIAEVWEAFVMGMAASAWGDIPYREALVQATPNFDPQLQVYADIQALLDKAITDLDGPGTGPGTFDLVYGGDAAKWKALAHTLKARFYMHTAEVDAGAYANALTQAQQGISDPANDFVAIHTTATSSRNLWFQFQTSSFGTDLVPGDTLVSIMEARNDPRLSEYFSADKTTLRGTRNDATFPQPLVTYAENQLIAAEAAFQTSGQAAAQPFLNAARQSFGLPTNVTATLQNIMTEKYIALFENMESFNDWKRTCIPAITPVNDSKGGIVPRRLFYGETEVNANPHAPGETEQLTRGGIGHDNPGDMHGFRNPNDPGDPPGCPSL